MSVHRRKRANGHTVWRGTWRDADDRQRAESYPTRREAELRDHELRELKWQDQIEAADAGRESLREAAEAWWTDHVEPNLARNTVLSYAHILDVHLLPRLGETPIREIDPARVIALQGQLRTSAVGGPMAHRILMVLSGIMRHGVLRGRIDRNPVQPVRVVQPKRSRAIRPLAPEAVERIRKTLLERRGGERHARECDGVRRPAPGGGDSAVLAPRRQMNAASRAKRRRGRRDEAHQDRCDPNHPLARPLADDLAQWRATSGQPVDDAPVAPRGDGGWWTATDYRNWRRRRFDPAVERSGLERARPYDLRHSYASLMVQAGYSPVELAAELGHTHRR